MTDGRNDDLSDLLGRLKLTPADLDLLTKLDASVPQSLRVKFAMAGAITEMVAAKGLIIPEFAAMVGLPESLAMATLTGAVYRIPAEKLMDVMVALGLNVSIMVWPADGAPAALSIHHPKASSPWSVSEVVCIEGVMSGAPCFRGTRIPAETVLSYARSRQSVQDIFGDYPSLPIDAIGALARWCASQLHRQAQDAGAARSENDGQGPGSPREEH